MKIRETLPNFDYEKFKPTIDEKERKRIKIIQKEKV